MTPLGPVPALADVPDARRGARFVCALALARPDGSIALSVEGEARGRILHGPRGDGDFGYDPLFYHQPFGCTFGEAAISDKMRVSHRAQALQAMFTYLRSRADERALLS